MDKQPSGFMARVMRLAGYVSVARARELSDKLSRVEQRNVALTQELDAVRQQSQALKEKLRERSDRLQQESAEHGRRYQERVAKLDQKTEQEIQRLREEIQRLRERDLARSAKLDEVRQRIAQAEKSTQFGREHLMAIEVKLDIVEGAIKVLDQRTRAALAAARDVREPVRESARLS